MLCLLGTPCLLSSMALKPDLEFTTGAAPGDIRLYDAQRNDCGELAPELLPKERLFWRQAVPHSADAQAMSLHYTESCKE